MKSAPVITIDGKQLTVEQSHALGVSICAAWDQMVQCGKDDSEFKKSTAHIKHFYEELYKMVEGHK